MEAITQRAGVAVEQLQAALSDYFCLGSVATAIDQWNPNGVVDQQTWENTSSNRSKKSVGFFLTAQESGILRAFDDKDDDMESDEYSSDGSSSPENVEPMPRTYSCGAIKKGLLKRPGSFNAPKRCQSMGQMHRRLSFSNTNDVLLFFKEDPLLADCSEDIET